MNPFNKGSLLILAASLFVTGFAQPILVSAAGPAPVNLLTAGNFVIISETGITNTGSHTSSITGDIGSSPISATAMNNIFCSEITGTIYGVDAAYVGSGTQTCFAGNPPLSNKTLIDNAVLDMGIAYTDAAGRTLPDGTELYAGVIGGQTFAPGLYKWSTSVSIPTSITLSGSASDVWIFQIAGDLTVASKGSIPAGVKIILAGGAVPSNVFWQVGGVTGATLGTYSTFNGTILSAKQIVMQTGTVFHGKALAHTQVTLDASTISAPIANSATLHIVKVVSNTNGKTSVPSDFNIYVKSSGVNVSGSPLPGESAPGVSYVLSAGSYVVSEDPNASYTTSFSGACDSSGTVTLVQNTSVTCTVTNSDIYVAPPYVAPVSSSSRSGGNSRNRTSSGGGYVPVATSTPVVMTSSGGSVPVTTTTATSYYFAYFPNSGFAPEESNNLWDIILRILN